MNNNQIKNIVLLFGLDIPKITRNIELMRSLGIELIRAHKIEEAVSRLHHFIPHDGEMPVIIIVSTEGNNQTLIYLLSTIRREINQSNIKVFMVPHELTLNPPNFEFNEDYKTSTLDPSRLNDEKYLAKTLFGFSIGKRLEDSLAGDSTTDAPPPKKKKKSKDK
jgi:hypothetical protein